MPGVWKGLKVSVVKKKKNKQAAQEILFERAEEEIRKFKELAQHRFKMAKAAYDYQDEETRHAISVIRDRLVLGSNGVVRISPRGANGESYSISVEVEFIEMNALFVATEVVKDLALFDIKLANYKFPPAFCAECGVSLKPSKKEKKVKFGG
jgi:hypothetical protein